VGPRSGERLSESSVWVHRVPSNEVEGAGTAADVCRGRDGIGRNNEPRSDPRQSRSFLVGKPAVKQEEEKSLLLISGDCRHGEDKRPDRAAVAQRGVCDTGGSAMRREDSPPRKSQRSARKDDAEMKNFSSAKVTQRTAAATPFVETPSEAATRATRTPTSPPSAPAAPKAAAAVLISSMNKRARDESDSENDAAGSGAPGDGNSLLRLRRPPCIWTDLEKEMMPGLMERFRGNRRKSLLIAEPLGSKTPDQVGNFLKNSRRKAFGRQQTAGRPNLGSSDFGGADSRRGLKGNRCSQSLRCHWTEREKAMMPELLARFKLDNASIANALGTKTAHQVKKFKKNIIYYGLVNKR